MKSLLTLHAVVFLVVEAEVVCELPAHHQLLNEGGHRLPCILPTALHLQCHPLGWQVAWWEEEELVEEERKEADKDGQNDVAMTNVSVSVHSLHEEVKLCQHLEPQLFTFNNLNSNTGMKVLPECQGRTDIQPACVSNELKVVVFFFWFERREGETHFITIQQYSLVLLLVYSIRFIPITSKNGSRKIKADVKWEHSAVLEFKTSFRLITKLQGLSKIDYNLEKVFFVVELTVLIANMMTSQHKNRYLSHPHLLSK